MFVRKTVFPPKKNEILPQKGGDRQPKFWELKMRDGKGREWRKKGGKHGFPGHRGPQEPQSHTSGNTERPGGYMD